MRRNLELAAVLRSLWPIIILNAPAGGLKLSHANDINLTTG
jgi:hypothetical protein